MVITNVNQVVYQGDGVNTAWPYTFKITDDDDRRLIGSTDIHLMLIDSDGTETEITSDFYVDINNDTVYYPGYAPGAEPPFADQPAPLQSGQRLMIYRKIPITQEKDLGDKWPFYVIELALDKLTMILQDVYDWLGRCLCVSKSQAYDAGDDFDPTVPLEADKVVTGNAAGDGFEAREALMEVNGAWDGEGRQIHSVADPTGDQDAATKKYADNRMDNNFMKLQPDGEAWEARNLPISNVGGPVLVKDAATKDYVDRILNGFVLAGDSRTVSFDTLEQLKTSDIEAGQIAFTLGYHDVNDGGAGVYVIRTVTLSDVDDGGSIIILDNGLVAELITDGTVTPEQFGAYGDNDHDDTTAIQNAINKFLKLNLGNKDYKITSTITIPSCVEIAGQGTRKSEIRYYGNGTALLISARGVKLSRFYVNNDSGSKGSTVGIANVERTPELIMQDVFVGGFYIGIEMTVVYMATFDRVTCNGCTYGFAFNKDTSLATSGTSTSLINCSCVDCDYGYHLERMVYTSLISCSSDHAILAYYFKNVQAHIDACGCESCGRAFKIYTYSSNIVFTNFYGYALTGQDASATVEYLAEFETNTRTFIDRQQVIVNGMDLQCADAVARSLTSVFYISGDARVSFKNLVIRPYVGFVPLWFNIVTPYIDMDYFRLSAVPTKGIIFGGQQIFKPSINYNDLTGDSYGWFAGRGGCAYKEDYDASNSYAVGDYIRYTDDKVYIALQANDSGDPHAPTDTDYWKATGLYSVIWCDLPAIQKS